MNRKERRALRVHEVAKNDQVQALARELAINNPDGLVLLLRYVDAGELQCCWCDCPMEDHQTPGYACDGCPDSAIYVFDRMKDGWGDSCPLCHRHWLDYEKTILKPLLLESGMPSEIRVYDAYDKDIV